MCGSGRHGSKNLDIAAKYGMPLNKGVPALAVLDADGKVVYAQRSGEFEKMRHMDRGFGDGVSEPVEELRAARSGRGGQDGGRRRRG